MKANLGTLALAAALLLALPLSSMVGQDEKAGGGKPAAAAHEEAGSGVKATVWQVDGTKSEVSDAFLQEEKIGILSLTKVPTDVFRIIKGKAAITTEIWRIVRIDVVGDTVRVTGAEGEPVEGTLDKNGRFFLLGKVGIGEFEINFADVRTVTFSHPKAKQLHCDACKRFYVQEWKYCPYEGARLKTVE
jgi:hypothetical protein